MALPSAVTLGSLAFVVVAGMGLAAAAAGPDDDAAPAAGTHEASPTSEAPTAPTSPIVRHHGRQHPSKHTNRPHRSVDAVPKTLVAVYNNSGITGLAADRAATLEGAGWRVAATDNWYGDIAANTVYFPPGLRSDAVMLATTLHITRLRPAVAPMQFDRLTVILTQA